jgi:hypothetical protein
VILPNPIFLYGGAIALVLAAGAGYKVRDWQCDAAYAKAIEKAAKKEREMRYALDQKGRDFEAAKDNADGVGAARAAGIRTIYREIPVPAADCAAPDSVVGLLQSGVDFANAAAAGEP